MVRSEGTIPPSEFVIKVIVHELQHQPAVEYEQLAVSTVNFMKVLIF
ncbi:hypothetical protein T03_6353 [Trichinella britovi]|uniref:Uncharacterized protein n=1 Tax=Trichinella britovi TaxID=45882 RepID=A0A0V1BNX9_TRIBR|nr:hypothetical protein T03_6353 [Trichinella britovi]